MTNTTIQQLQEHLIKRVQSTTDVDKLIRFLIFLDELPISEDSAKRIFRPLRKGISLEQLKKEQHSKGTNWANSITFAKTLNGILLTPN